MASQMLDRARMKTASLIPALALVLGFGFTEVAHAGGFVGLGLGSPSKLQYEDGLGYFNATGRSGKIFGGYAYPVPTGTVAAEASYVGFGLFRNGNDFDGSVIALAAKYNHKLADGFQAFARLGVQHTSLETSAGGASTTLAGTGVLLGGGFEYHPPLKLPVDGALFVDINYTNTELTRNENPGGASSDDVLFSLGVVVGF